MATPKKGPRLGGSPSHQRKLLSNLATQLIQFGSIETTEAKAKLLQPYFEKLVTKAKRGTIHDRRQVSRTISDRDAVYELFDVIVPDLDPERHGGYTRITKIGKRRGDSAPMAVIEIVMEPVIKKATVKAAETVTERAADKEAEVATEELVEELVEVAEALEDEVEAELEEELEDEDE